MSKLSLYAGFASLALAGIFLAGRLPVAGGIGKFSPPRVAVVSISEVFDLYAKRKDRQEVLQGRMNELKKTLADLEKQYNDLNAELRQLKEESPLYLQKSLERFELEQRVKQLRSNELKELRDTQVAFLRELRDEISKEITAYATAHDLELVVEKEVVAESETGGLGFRWPIVHYTKPELDVTSEIADRLNSRYQRKP